MLGRTAVLAHAVERDGLQEQHARIAWQHPVVLLQRGVGRTGVAQAQMQGRGQLVRLRLLRVDRPGGLDMALRLEEIALNDEYFIERKLYPNVDFYTGLIYKAMGFSASMFTPLFALGRMPGWIAQWREMMKDPQTKIGRPRQVYTGATSRDYVPAADR